MEPLPQESKHSKYYNCCLPQCRGWSYDIVHKFPRNPERLKAWLDALQQPRLAQMPVHKLTRCIFICGRHFRKEDYVHSESRIQNRMAVPSLNLKDLSELNMCKKVGCRPNVNGGCKIALEIENDEKRKKGSESKVKRNDVESTKTENAENILIVSLDLSETHVSSSTNSSELRKKTKEIESREIQESLPDKLKPSSDIELIDMELKGRIYKLNFKSNLEVDAVYLRSLCKCDMCFDHRMDTRKIGFFELSQDLRPDVGVVLEQENQLQIIWSDGHISNYDIAELYVLCSRPGILFSHWLEEDFTPMTYNDLICDERNVRLALDRLKRSGVVVIDNLNVDEVCQRAILTELLLRRLMPRLPPNLAKESRYDFPASQIIPHTNCTFTSVDCGLQVLSLSLKQTSDVNIVLADGHQVAHAIKRTSMPTFKSLVLTKFRNSYRNHDGLKYNYQAPIVQISSEGVERINFAVYHSEPVSQRNFESSCESIGEFARLMQDEKYQRKLQFTRDRLILIDNWRICWQVSAVDTMEGEKQTPALECLYVERKHFKSHLMVKEREDGFTDE